MAEQMRPASKEQAPDPSRSYERARPEEEAGMGRMDNNKGTPTPSPDQVDQAVTHKQEPRQINAHEVVNEREEQASEQQLNQQPNQQQSDHSMKDDEPLGEDQAPTDIKKPRAKRHPRTEGKGGTP